MDGRFAGGGDECAWVIGTDTYQKLAALIQANDSTSATERLRRILRDFMASANIPAAASDVQQGILAKLGAQDGFYNAVCPVWEGLRLIRDEVTQAAQGLVQITAVALHNFRLVQPASDGQSGFASMRPRVFPAEDMASANVPAMDATRLQ